MVTRESVGAILDRVRPFLQADGGDVEVVAVGERSVAVHLRGRCATCPSAHMTLTMGIEAALRDEIPDLETVRLV